MLGNGSRAVAVDDWDARPIDVTASVSVVDHKGYGCKSGSWQEHCRDLREGQTIQRHPQAEDRWTARVRMPHGRRSY